MLKEQIVETKICKHCGTSFDITDADVAFYDKISPTFGGKKFQVPSPVDCLDCRQKKRLCTRNERNLYRRTCDLTGKSIISIYSPDSGYTVYDQHEWRSDRWNPLQYGRDFDFTKTFNEQFNELLKAVPRISVNTLNNENSDYVNQCRYLKNCYMCFDNGFNEDCFYDYRTYHSKNVVDGMMIEEGELLYQCVNVKKSYKLYYSQDCKSCTYSHFLKNCENCNYCLCCVNLVGKNYCIYNKQYAKEEYEKYLSAIDFGSRKQMQEMDEKFRDFSMSFPRKNLQNTNSEDSLGEYLSNCKHCKHSFGVNNSQDCKYVFDIDDDIKDCMDINNGAEGNLMYNSNSASGYNLFCVRFVGRANNIYYCESCTNINDCFGCVGLHSNQQYCIFNKQYTKSEYDTLLAQIIAHMQTTGERGEFFDPAISTIGYNESEAQEYFPFTHDEAIRQGFKRSDYEALFPQVEKIIPAKDLPDNIQGVTDDIVQQAIECEVSKKPFRIIKQELDFYRKHSIPMPRKHFEVRLNERMDSRNPRKLFDRKCAKCGINIKTTYAPERPEIIYCETCYNKEIYG